MSVLIAFFKALQDGRPLMLIIKELQGVVGFKVNGSIPIFL